MAAGQAGQLLRPRGEALLVGIGEVSLVVQPLALATLEAAIQHPAGLEGAPQAREGVRQLAGGHMQQAGAGPDAVVALDFVDLCEAPDRHGHAEQLAGVLGQLGAGIEGADLMAALTERQGIASRATAGIEDMRVGRQFSEEGRVERLHVHAQGIVDELLGVALVVGVGTTH
ncbi:hypothetical protein D3C78_1148990 [compost metagenome]